MPDEISTIDDLASFAYNVENGHPWHQLGEQVDGYMDIETALRLIGVDIEVVTSEDAWVVDPNSYGDPDGIRYVQVPDKTVVYSSVFGPMGVHGSKYEIMERREFLSLAYDLIGLDPDARRLDTIGNLGDYGERFFFYIREDDLVIDPNGVADNIERGYMGVTSFNGVLPSTLGRTAIRAVCANTVALGLKTLEKGIKAAHYPGAEQRLRFLAKLYDYAGAYDKALVEKAEEMLRVDGRDAIERIKDGFWPMEDEMTDAIATKRLQNRGILETLYDGPGNLSKDKLGANGWAAYNAFTEYADHRLEVRGKGKDANKVRAERAVLPGPVWQQKAKAAGLVLA